MNDSTLSFDEVDKSICPVSCRLDSTPGYGPHIHCCDCGTTHLADGGYQEDRITGYDEAQRCEDCDRYICKINCASDLFERKVDGVGPLCGDCRLEHINKIQRMDSARYMITKEGLEWLSAYAAKRNAEKAGAAKRNIGDDIDPNYESWVASL